MPSDYAVNYLVVLISLLLSVGLILFTFLLSFFLAPHQSTPQKGVNYECGIPPIGRYWSQMYLRYYLFAFLFLIFDVEAVFLFPWALVVKGRGDIFFEMFIFLGVLLFGLVYGWKKGALKWR